MLTGTTPAHAPSFYGGVFRSLSEAINSDPAVYYTLSSDQFGSRALCYIIVPVRQYFMSTNSQPRALTSSICVCVSKIDIFSNAIDSELPV